jgi:hypothetical protein
MRPTRIGKGKGMGKGYKNIIQGYDSRVHQQSGKGIKQPQRMSNHISAKKLNEGLITEKRDAVSMKFYGRPYGWGDAYEQTEVDEAIEVGDEVVELLAKGVGKSKAINDVSMKYDIDAKSIKDLMDTYEEGGVMYGKSKASMEHGEPLLSAPPSQEGSWSKAGASIVGGVGSVVGGIGDFIGGVGDFIGSSKDLAKARELGKEKEYLEELEKYESQKKALSMEQGIKLKHGSDPDTKFDKSQLSMGIRVETEHTNDKGIAKQIAKAHLSEDPRYYTKLKKVEGMTHNMASVKLVRDKKQEEPNVPIWLRDKKNDIIISVVGQEGNVRMRVSSPKGSKEYMLVGAIPESLRNDPNKLPIKRALTELGYKYG